MLIDWFTVAAQVVNFLVLVWLMKRFLYKPVLSAIDARESAISAKLSDADAKKAEAQKQRDIFQQKTAALEKQSADLLHKATEEAGAERERLLAGARKDAGAARATWQDALRNDQQGLSDEIVLRTRRGVFDIARKVLADLATASLEECMAGVFIGRLRSLDSAAHDALAASLKSPRQSALVRSAFELPPTQRAAIESAVRETFTVDAPLDFETSPDLVSGIELSANGLKVAWSVSDFLASLEKDVNARVEEEAKPANATAPPVVASAPVVEPSPVAASVPAPPAVAAPEPVAALVGR